MYLNSLKLNMSAMVVLKSAESAGALDITVAVLILFVLNSIPIVLSKLLYNNTDMFEDEMFTKKYGTLYQGRNVSQDRDHNIFLSPLVFFYRRTLFVAITVFLFDYPSMQMISH